MIEDNHKFNEMLDTYPICKECIDLQINFWENEKAFELLMSEREKIPSEMYGTMLRRLYCEDTDGVQLTTLIKAFSDTNRKDIMCKEDLVKFNAMPDEIEIFRGTQDYDELVPRFSWSLKESVAKGYGPAHMFRAIVNKEQVLAYFSKDTDEEEILIWLETGFEMLY